MSAPQCMIELKENDLVCVPLKNYKEVLNWKISCPRWPESVINLVPRTDHSFRGTTLYCHSSDVSCLQEHKHILKKDTPKTLFCHDLKGGYLEDRFVNGSSHHKEYRFFHWAGIDTFIYFSHHFITIPPLGWINAAHLHGVKILGTLITEWKEGESIWKEIHESETTVKEFVNCLVDICEYFCFDGYLLNIENKIEPKNVELLELFVCQLHDKLAERVPHCELIWYDSVTKNGDLKWQNELNDLNSNFFDKCDGIFLNYTWTENNLIKSVENSGDRNLDVYVGIDVFGRNCFGGGGFNTCKALELVRKYNLSTALFAPSWVHEYLGQDHFATHEYAFWQSLWPFLYIHGPTQLPFSTTFCQGFGRQLYHHGKVVSTSPWYNLSEQQYQPSVPSCLTARHIEAKAESDEQGLIAEACCQGSVRGCIQHCSSDAFTGGGCLQIQHRMCSVEDVQRIFVCELICVGPTLIYCATKVPGNVDATFNLVVLMQNESKNVMKKVLVCGEPSDLIRTEDSKVYPLSPQEVVLKDLPVIQDVAHGGWKIR